MDTPPEESPAPPAPPESAESAESVQSAESVEAQGSQEPTKARAGGGFLQSDRAHHAVVWLSRAALFALLATFVVAFVKANWGMLVDPELQNDDARTVLFPFHRYGSADSLQGDPIADEMLALVPWGTRLLYLIFVPLVDVYAASKLVQLVAFSVLVWAAVVLLRARRTGFAGAALLLFFFLHTPFAVDRIAGGLPRSFGVPCFALWLAGILANNRTARFSAPVILALTYPSVMNMILAAEGLLAVRGAFRIDHGVILRRLRRYGIVVGACLICVLPAAWGDSSRGAIHTYEEAQHEPAFGRSGRLWILPFEEPARALSNAFLDVTTPQGQRPLASLDSALRDKGMIAVLLVAGFLLIPLLRLGPPPSATVALFVGTCVIYGLSRSFAFRLYSPERYYSFGMRMVCLSLLISCGVQAFYWVRPRYREITRNAFALGLIGVFWLTTGDGLRKDTGMTIRRQTDEGLYDFVRTLPKDVRFAAHVLDGDGLPLWGARAHTGSFETLQPWFKGSWARQKSRMLDTLDALYATDQQALLRFADKYKVTHFLVNRGRFGKNTQRKAGSFEPFTAKTRELLRGRDAKEMLLNKPPQEAVIFDEGRFLIVSVEKLRASWKNQ